MKEFVDKALQELKTTVPGFKSFTITHIKDGTVLSTVKDPSYTGVPELEAAFQLEIIKQTFKSIEISGHTDPQIHDILIEADDLTYMLAISPQKKTFAAMIYDNSKCSLGIARGIMAKGKKDIGEWLDMQL